jgi:hypothetical protein
MKIVDKNDTKKKMKTKILLLAVIFTISMASAEAQLHKEKRNKYRQEKKLERRKAVNDLMDIKNFVFVPTKAFPMGGSAIDLTTGNYSVKFSPNRIISYMPFFGEAYNIDYRGDPGFKFDLKPSDFDISRLKSDKGFDVKASVSLPSDNIKLRMEVGAEGTSTLTVLSDKRNSISYFGYIKEPEQQNNTAKKE